MQDTKFSPAIHELLEGAVEDVELNQDDVLGSDAEGPTSQQYSDTYYNYSSPYYNYSYYAYSNTYNF